MPLNSMARRMCLEIPGLADVYAATLLNEALQFIQDLQMWSFQLKTGGWLTPGLLFPVSGGAAVGTSVGTVAVTPYSNVVVADAASSAAWAAYVANNSQPLFTALQFRSPYYSLYNIIGIQTGQGGGYGSMPYGTGGYGGNTGIAVLNLDRPWMEPGGAGQSYMIYQAYFPVPVTDFKRFLSARDTTNDWPIDYWTKSQKDLAAQDPERVIFDDPSYFVPFEVDQRQGSATFGQMLYELWPHPLSVLPYTFQYLRRGPQLQAPGDTVPYPFTEEVVLWQAKLSAYLFKAAQKGEDMERGKGADWKFLAQMAEAMFKKKLQPIKDRDRDMVELYMTRYNIDPFNNGEPYANMTGGLNVGTM